MRRQSASRGPIGLLLRYPSIGIAAAGVGVLIGPRLAARPVFHWIERHNNLPTDSIGWFDTLIALGPISIRVGTFFNATTVLGITLLSLALVLAIFRTIRVKVHPSSSSATIGE